VTRVGIVGATGVVGQQFVVALQRHPGSRSAGWRRRSDRRIKPTARRCAIRNGRSTLVLRRGTDVGRARPVVESVGSFDPARVDSSSPRSSRRSARDRAGHRPDDAGDQHGSAFRYENDVPLIIPGLNSCHGRLIRHQQERRGWRGFIAPNPNCTTVGLAITLRPLFDQFGIQAVLMTSLQSMSGPVALRESRGLTLRHVIKLSRVKMSSPGLPERDRPRHRLQRRHQDRLNPELVK